MILYASMYGACEEAAGIVIRGLEINKKRPVVFGFTDSGRPRMSELIREVVDAESPVIIAPTYEGGIFPPASYVVNLMVRKTPENKPVLILSSYAWAGVAGKKLAELFRSAKFPVVDVVEFDGRPDGESEKRIIEATRQLISYSQSP